MSGDKREVAREWGRVWPCREKDVASPSRTIFPHGGGFHSLATAFPPTLPASRRVQEILAHTPCARSCQIRSSSFLSEAHTHSRTYTHKGGLAEARDVFGVYHPHHVCVCVCERACSVKSAGEGSRSPRG